MGIRESRPHRMNLDSEAFLRRRPIPIESDMLQPYGEVIVAKIDHKVVIHFVLAVPEVDLGRSRCKSNMFYIN
jgi:hypothetical protein